MDRIFEYLPLITTVLAAFFAIQMYRDYRSYKTLYFLWWTIGILNYGMGNLSESINVILGWSVGNFKFWYITGALLGGFTLAHGNVYFLLPRKFGNLATAIGLSYIVFAIVCILLSPIQLPDDFKGKLSGDVFEWQWIRFITLPVNIYAFIFSFGSAIYLANQYFSQIDKENRFLGILYISLGTLIPSIGGFYTKIGYGNILFITGLIGICLIYWGYRTIKQNLQ